MPPVPWRKLALGSLLGLVGLGVAAAVIVPAIDEKKDKAAVEERRKTELRRRAETVRLREEQRPRRATVPAGASPLRTLEAAITRDARSRLEDPVTSTSCERSGVPQIYKCLAVTSESRLPGETVFETGYPFVARVDGRKLAWCKQNPTAGEKAGDAFAKVPISRKCAGRLADVL